jgi:type I restriction enzyme R subunit
VGFVNGLPLVFIELKAAHKKLKSAFDNNLRDYKNTLPHLFWYNAFIILSNGSHSLMGSLTGEWEHFADWKKINSEGEQGIISLDTLLRGTCEPARLLDIVENFILFTAGKSGLEKLVARNHQYLGVNNAIRAVQEIRQNQGRLGVFWHTQGSGKSYSMVFFAQKVLRKLPGNWTFVVVTDRDDLDDQIYKNFARAGVVTEPEDAVRAASGEHLKQLLCQDHRYVFTLVQKFHTRKGETYPVLSTRSDIIVMPDEAHRTQYDALALNMRNGLPNAAFIAYTGTPLMAGEEKTRQVFGPYVSIYNFKQSADDHNTVPLYYENRIPELQLTNAQLNRDMERLLEEAELDEAQEAKLEREFSRDA